MPAELTPCTPLARRKGTRQLALAAPRKKSQRMPARRSSRRRSRRPIRRGWTLPRTGTRTTARASSSGAGPFVIYPFWYRLLSKDDTPMIHVDTCIIGAKCIISYYRVSSLIHVLAMYYLCIIAPWMSVANTCINYVSTMNYRPS